MTIYTETAKAPSFKGGGNRQDVSSQVLNFALNKDKVAGDVSRPIYDGTQLYVIQIKKKINKGVPDFEDVKQRMRYAALNELAAEQFKKDMAGYTSLEELAGKMGLEIKSAEVNLKEANIPQVGNEPKVVGAIFSGIQKGEKTAPIEGNAGVYVVEVVEVNDPQETTDYTKYIEEIEKSKSPDNNYSNALQGLMQKYEPVDDRMRYRYGAK